MSATGFLLCPSCKVCIALGKPVQREDNSVKYFHIGFGPPRNSARTLLNESVWKFLADHYGHQLRVLSDYDDEQNEIYEYTEIGADEADGHIPFEKYLHDWEGLTEPGSGDLTVEKIQRPAVQVEHFTGSIPQSSVTVHVDLPHSLVNQWLSQFGEGQGKLISTSVRNTASSGELLRSLGQGPPFLPEQLGSVDAQRIVFTHFEQLWTKNRPVAIELLRALPLALAHARSSGRSLHIALADLSSGSADAILTELRNAPSEGIEEPIIVIAYPAMP
jgi:hypothetical protein